LKNIKVVELNLTGSLKEEKSCLKKDD